MLTLYSYFRSSAAYRVRIALNLKQVEYQLTTINLLSGEQHSAEYRMINPQGLLPSLQTDNGEVLHQSTAILEWLEETYTSCPLLPSDPLQRARVRELCSLIACEVHPLNNLRVQQYLSDTLQIDDAAKKAWVHHWIEDGFKVIESSLLACPFSMGESPGWVDVYLVPQVFNALRFGVDMASFPKIMAVYHACADQEAFKKASPEQQPDAI